MIFIMLPGFARTTYEPPGLQHGYASQAESDQGQLEQHQQPQTQTFAG